MATRPNFTDVERRNGAIVLTGQSDPDPAGDILGIHVVLSQGAQTAAATARQLGANWNVEVPAEGFNSGPATVAGVETRRENATTTTWAQPVEIP
ncbi:MAG TPA: hypothetical protein VFX51_07160 [Solirubrobacteraceae bacterium]|nr:hypothetical protein [Solirubrobacteraceae bacterium]